MPLDAEFRHHLHELMVETSDKLREELSSYKQKLVWEAQKRNNSAGIPIAYSDAAEYAFRARVEATIKGYLEALEKCGIVVDAVVETEMLQEIGQLTGSQHPLSLPPGVTGPTVGAVKAEHARRMARAGNALQREAANRLREIKMRTARSAPAAAHIPTMPQSTPFTIAFVTKTLAELKALPMEEQAKLLLRRLVQIYPTVRNTDKFNKHNILMPGDTYQVAAGFSDAERTPVLQHLLGGPWTRLVNEGYLVDPAGSDFFDISEEGFVAAEQAAKPKPIAVQTKEAPADGVPTVFISYSYDSPEHKEWVLRLAEKLHGQGGVNVILDRWHLRMGEDKTLFIEKNIAASNFVLIVCTPEYARKANNRQGGVGYEAMIITGELAQNIQQRKFIPVLRQGEWDKTSLPSWLGTRIGADLRGDSYDEEQYDLLLRELHGAHLKPPPVGPKPVFTDRGDQRGQDSSTNKVAVSPQPANKSAAAGNSEVMPVQSAIAYAVYQTKGPEAHQVEAYVRPIDSKGERFRLETSTGEIAEGTLSEIAQRYLIFDHQLRTKRYSRMQNFNGAGQSFNLP